MLVLSRKEKESIVVAENIVISVQNIGRGRVKIGIEAPAEVSIRRSELKQIKVKEVA